MSQHLNILRLFARDNCSKSNRRSLFGTLGQGFVLIRERFVHVQPKNARLILVEYLFKILFTGRRSVCHSAESETRVPAVARKHMVRYENIVGSAMHY